MKSGMRRCNETCGGQVLLVRKGGVDMDRSTERASRGVGNPVPSGVAFVRGDI